MKQYMMKLLVLRKQEICIINHNILWTLHVYLFVQCVNLKVKRVNFLLQYASELLIIIYKNSTEVRK